MENQINLIKSLVKLEYNQKYTQEINLLCALHLISFNYFIDNLFKETLSRNLMAKREKKISLIECVQ